MATAKKTEDTAAVETTEAPVEAPAEDLAPTEAEAPRDEQALKNKLRGQAERTILDKYKDEFYAEAERLFSANGLEFVRRLTPAEKAEQKLKNLLAENPELAQKYAPVAS